MYQSQKVLAEQFAENLKMLQLHQGPATLTNKRVIKSLFPLASYTEHQFVQGQIILTAEAMFPEKSESIVAADATEMMHVFNRRFDMSWHDIGIADELDQFAMELARSTDHILDTNTLRALLFRVMDIETAAYNFSTYFKDNLKRIRKAYMDHAQFGGEVRVEIAVDPTYSMYGKEPLFMLQDHTKPFLNTYITDAATLVSFSNEIAAHVRTAVFPIKEMIGAFDSMIVSVLSDMHTDKNGRLAQYLSGLYEDFITAYVSKITPIITKDATDTLRNLHALEYGQDLKSARKNSKDLLAVQDALKDLVQEQIAVYLKKGYLNGEGKEAEAKAVSIKDINAILDFASNAQDYLFKFNHVIRGQIDRLEEAKLITKTNAAIKQLEKALDSDGDAIIASMVARGEIVSIQSVNETLSQSLKASQLGVSFGRWPKILTNQLDMDNGLFERLNLIKHLLQSVPTATETAVNNVRGKVTLRYVTTNVGLDVTDTLKRMKPILATTLPDKLPQIKRKLLDALATNERNQLKSFDAYEEAYNKASANVLKVYDILKDINSDRKKLNKLSV